MTNGIALDALIDGLEMQNDEMTAYLDCNTGTVVFIGNEYMALSVHEKPRDWDDAEREMIEVLREVEAGSQRYVALPSTWDVNEWDIMRRFCDTVAEEAVRELLLRAIHGRGAFRRFRGELDRRGLQQRWFEFKRDALREHAVKWCTENDIAFK